MFLLQKNTQLMRVHANRLASLVNNLKGMNVPQKTQDGKETQGSLLIKALELLMNEASSLSVENDKVFEELNALSEQHDIGNTPNEAVNKVVEAIRSTNAKFGSMSPDEVLKELGLRNDQETH
nr:MAG TPA: hypothetical protein [Caudoviricetes sp.]